MKDLRTMFKEKCKTKKLLIYLFAYSIVFIFLTINFAFAQSCKDGVVSCPGTLVPCCDQFEPACNKKGIAKCCEKKPDGTLNCKNKYSVQCKIKCPSGEKLKKTVKLLPGKSKIESTTAKTAPQEKQITKEVPSQEKIAAQAEAIKPAEPASPSILAKTVEPVEPECEPECSGENPVCPNCGGKIFVCEGSCPNKVCLNGKPKCGCYDQNGNRYFGKGACQCAPVCSKGATKPVCSCPGYIFECGTGYSAVCLEEEPKCIGSKGDSLGRCYKPASEAPKEAAPEKVVATPVEVATPEEIEAAPTEDNPIKRFFDFLFSIFRR